MLEYFRQRMGFLLWIVLFLVIGGFVFMGTGSSFAIDFSKSLYVIDNETFTDREMKQFAKENYASHLYTDAASLNDQINQELSRENPDDKVIQNLQEQLQDVQSQLDEMAVNIAWDKDTKNDGVEVGIEQASQILKDNPTQAWLSLKSDGGNFLEGLDLTPRGHDLLRNFAHTQGLELHSDLYQSCISLPTALTYSGLNRPRGYRYDTLIVSADYATLPTSHLDSYVVSYDETDIKAFYDQRKNIEISERNLGYKKPSDYSLTCLVAVSQDFTAQVEVDVVSLREFYDRDKYRYWQEDDEGEVFVPFKEVRKQAEELYRYQEGSKLAEEHLKEALEKWQGGADTQELQDSYRLQIHTFEKIQDVTRIPNFDYVINPNDVDSLETNEIFSEAKKSPQGALIFRLDEKNVGSSPEFEDIKDQVLQDYLLQKKLNKARELLSTFKKEWDKAGDLKAAQNTLKEEALKLPGIDSFPDLILEDLGSIRASTMIPKIEKTYWIQPQLIKAVFSQTAKSSSVEINRDEKNCLILLARDHVFDSVNSDNETFSDVYSKAYDSSRSALFNSYKNEYKSRLYNQKVRRIN